MSDYVQAIKNQTKHNFDKYCKTFNINKHEFSPMETKFNKKLQQSPLFTMIQIADLVQKPNFSVENTSRILKKYKEPWGDVKATAMEWFVSMLDDLASKILSSVDYGSSPRRVAKIVADMFDDTPLSYKKNWIGETRFYHKFIEFFNIWRTSEHNNNDMNKILSNIVAFSSIECITNLPDNIQHYIAYDMRFDRKTTIVGTFMQEEYINDVPSLILQLRSVHRR